MKPMCETSVNDSKRLISFCAIAPKIPMSIVARATIISSESKLPSVNTVVRMRMMA